MQAVTQNESAVSPFPRILEEDFFQRQPSGKLAPIKFSYFERLFGWKKTTKHARKANLVSKGENYLFFWHSEGGTTVGPPHPDFIFLRDRNKLTAYLTFDGYMELMMTEKNSTIAENFRKFATRVFEELFTTGVVDMRQRAIAPTREQLLTMARSDAELALRTQAVFGSDPRVTTANKALSYNAITTINRLQTGLLQNEEKTPEDEYVTAAQMLSLHPHLRQHYTAQSLGCFLGRRLTDEVRTPKVSQFRPTGQHDKVNLYPLQWAKAQLTEHFEAQEAAQRREAEQTRSFLAHFGKST